MEELDTMRAKKKRRAVRNWGRSSCVAVGDRNSMELVVEQMVLDSGKNSEVVTQLMLDAQKSPAMKEAVERVIMEQRKPAGLEAVVQKIIEDKKEMVVVRRQHNILYIYCFVLCCDELFCVCYFVFCFVLFCVVLYCIVLCCDPELQKDGNMGASPPPHPPPFSVNVH